MSPAVSMLATRCLPQKSRLTERPFPSMESGFFEYCPIFPDPMGRAIAPDNGGRRYNPLLYGLIAESCLSFLSWHGICNIPWIGLERKNSR
jgi:hypothetical protein